MTALCVGACRPATHGGPRQPRPGRHLCPVCTDRVWEDLHAIADAWDDLEHRLAVPAASALQERVRTSPDPGLRINLAVSDVLREARSWLWFVARLVMDERRLSVGPVDQTPRGLALWLAARHVDWLGGHHDEQLAGSFSVEARAHAKAVKSKAYPSGWRVLPLDVGCVEHGVTESGERVPCGGTMFALLDPDATTVPNLTCTVDRTHQVDPGTYARPGWRRGFDPAAVAAFTRRVAG